MGSVTGIFTAENQIHPAAQAILEDAFSQGWADPAKLHRHSGTLNTLLAEARENFAQLLKVPHQSLYFLGEPALGFHLGINGLASSGIAYLPTTSRQEIFAACSIRSASMIHVDMDGRWIVPHGGSDDLLVLPTVNLETGTPGPESDDFLGRIFVDSSADPFAPLPSRWSAALWDSVSWQGPRGLGVLALSDLPSWRNPLPHNDHGVVPGGANPALIIASAIALDAYNKDLSTSRDRMIELNDLIRTFITHEIGDVDIASPSDSALHLLSFSFLYLQAEQLVDEMERR
jgi:cysteine desulfurase